MIHRQKLRRFFARIETVNPKWTYPSLLDETAEQFDISARTVKAILNREGIYAD
jgi:hypothetical protein